MIGLMLNNDRTNADHQTDADCHDHGNPKNETDGGGLLNNY